MPRALFSHLPSTVVLLSLLGVLLAVGIMLIAGVIFFMARVLLSPPRMDDPKAAWLLQRLTPGDLKMRFAKKTFEVRDERTGEKLKIAAWWIPHADARGRCVVLIHGYADAKVGAIAWAPTFHAIGLNILAIDLRAHGESEGPHTTGGFFERHDVSQVIDQLRAERPDETRRLVLFGVSLGAAVAAATVVLRHDSLGTSDIDAVILECPFADYRDAIRAHCRVLGMPGDRMVRTGVWLAQKRSGADFGAVRPVDLIPRIQCPLMVIRSDADLFITPTDAERVEKAALARRPEIGPTIYWQAENAHHVAALYEDPELYRERIADFLGMLPIAAGVSGDAGAPAPGASSPPIPAQAP